MNLFNSCFLLRDLRWRLKQLPPRTRLLARWSLQVHLGGLGLLLTSGVLASAVSIGSGSLAMHLALNALLPLLGGLFFTAVGAWQARRRRPQVQDISRLYDARWSVFLGEQLFAGLVMVGLSFLLIRAGAFGGPAGDLARQPFAGKFAFFTGASLMIDGARMLTALLRDLPPPRPRRARSRVRPAFPVLARPLT